MKLRRMDYVHINGEGELIERPSGLLVDYANYAELEATLRKMYQFAFIDRWGAKGFDDEAQALHDEIKSLLGIENRPCFCEIDTPSAECPVHGS